jgi:hypothetical protein
MTATEMEEVLTKLDLRLTNVEQILPTLATKEDLKAFATKEDLKAYATREELKELFATKEETKELFAEARRHARVLFEQLEEKLEIIATHVADISRRLPPRS